MTVSSKQLVDVGRVVEFIESRKVMCGVCLDVKTGRLHILTETNREMSIPFNRIVYTSTYKLDDLARHEIIKRLGEIVRQREALKEEVSPQELWNLLHKESEHFDAQSLAELCFSGEVSSDHISAVIRSLFEDKIYFRLKGNMLSPNPPYKVEQILLQMRREEEKEKDLTEGGEWLSAIWEGRSIEEPRNKERYINILKELAVFWKDSVNYQRGKELLLRAGLTEDDAAFNLLVKMGIFTEDENIFLHQYKIHIHFPIDVIDEAHELTNKNVSIEVGATLDRKDLRYLSIITVDKWGTRDHDDGLSIERKGDRCQVGIHIADASHYVPLDSVIDREAQARGTSIYLPDMRIPMIPDRLSQEILSLEEGQDKLALSILVELDSHSNVVSYEVHPSLVNVKRRLSYDEVEGLVNYDPDLRSLYSVSRGLCQRRISQGALFLPIPEIHVYVDKTHKEIKVEKVNPQSPGREIVSEFMILANWLTGRFFKEKGTPIIYRTQETPREYILDMKADDLYINYKQRRFLSRAQLGIEPKPHSTLGVEVYTTVTSPIRRYLDLVVQRQMSHVLRGGDGVPYSPDTLSRIAMALEETQKNVNLIRQNRTRYWLLKHLQGMIGEKMETLVLESLPHKYRLLLIEYLLEVEAPLEEGFELSPGDRVYIKVIKVDAREDMIRVVICQK